MDVNGGRGKIIFGNDLQLNGVKLLFGGE